jgi:ribosomal protein L6P/L9E
MILRWRSLTQGYEIKMKVTDIGFEIKMKVTDIGFEIKMNVTDRVFWDYGEFYW